MNEKRFEVIDNGFSMWIVDTTLTEDKHEGAIYTAYDMCRKLNELYEENEQLKQKLENLGLNEKNDMVEYSIEDFFRWLQRIKKEFEDFEDNGD